MKSILSAAFSMIIINAMAQDSSRQNNPLSFTGYAEAYYSYDFNKPGDNNRPPFIYSHNRHNEFNINLAFIKANYNTDMIRANLALGTGTYMNANYAAETGTLKNIYEANIGARLSKKANLWIDAGIFSSHIGFESAMSSTCLNLSRSIIADNSPYFESGVKITYTTSNNKWLLSAMALNGWQRIERVPGNSMMSCGTQVQYIASDKLTFNYSTFIGTDKPDSIRQLRHFHNLYGIFHFSKKVQVIIGVDIGQEQKAKGSHDYNTWYGTAAILQSDLGKGNTIALRGEYYSDKKGVIINTGTINGFKTSGFSVNFDKKINNVFLWRTEVKTLISKDRIFVKDNRVVNNNTAITTSFAITF